MSRQEQYEFNKNQGLETYIDPFTKLFCVKISNAPEIGRFYLVNETEPTNVQMESLKSDPYKNGFTSTLFDFNNQNLAQQLRAFYGMGEKMKTMIQIDATTSLNSQYKDSFPFPKADAFGVCNNFKSAHFMMDDQSSCLQKVNIETECANTLNAEFYSSKLKFYLGQAGKIADAKAFEVSEVWSFDDDTSVYTKSDASNLASKATKNGEDCTCENYLKEIEYTVEIEKNSET